MHHRGDAESTERPYLDAVALHHLRGETGVAGLEPFDDRFQRVRPDPVDEVVLPGSAARGQNAMPVIDEDGFDGAGTEFDAQGGTALLNGCS